MPEDGARIGELQASEVGLRLQRAADTCHRQAQRLDLLRLFVSGVVGLFASVTTTSKPTLRASASIIGVLWTLVAVYFLRTLIRHKSTTGALIQEEFDSLLYAIPRDAALRQIPHEDIARLARGSSLSEQVAQRWYPDLTGIPVPYAALLCQAVNLSWDVRVRRRWTALLATLLCLWASAGIVIGLVNEWTIAALALQWLLPGSALAVVAAEELHRQREVAREKRILRTTVTTELDGVQADLPPEEQTRLGERCRNVQTQLTNLRRNTARPPRLLYERKRYEDGHDMAAMVEQVRERMRRAT